MSTIRTRVLHFMFCHSIDCQFSDDLHLLISPAFVNLEHGNAIALSYTWGEYEREKRAIGHDSDGTPILMQLGAEWELSELVATLHTICIEINPYCWIDQLSIDQKDDAEVRATLAKIPDVYRTFDVVVLLPGAMCECVRERYEGQQENPEAWTSGDLRSAQEIGSALSCWNNIGYSNWFLRLWPRQELMYARNIRARWTSEASLDCPQKKLVEAGQASLNTVALLSLIRDLTATASVRCRVLFHKKHD